MMGQYCVIITLKYDKYLYSYTKCFKYILINKYSPKWSWLELDVNRAAKYSPLTTSTSVKSC